MGERRIQICYQDMRDFQHLFLQKKYYMGVIPIKHSMVYLWVNIHHSNNIQLFNSVFWLNDQNVWLSPHGTQLTNQIMSGATDLTHQYA